ncbi:MAG: T9SS type A sorting domain-containing protein, partial [Gemmatimonadetes bacterium]|nr:T9SS type A sorting domain-containing protein [Gemmatimonadota bacterium]
VGEGPTGVALDEVRNKLYVVNRFDSDLSVVDLTDDSSVLLPLGFDPSDSKITDGRWLLYDAEGTSAHGDISCASCHVFGEMDNIAWELGSPNGTFVNPVNPLGSGFHPIKGPMATQTLKGLSNNAPFHWRGDFAVFSDFNNAFVALQGRQNPIAPALMTDFEEFVQTLITTPNPNRNIDDTMPISFNGGDPARGEQLFSTGGLFQVIGVSECVDCHILPTGARGTVIPPINVEGTQDMVVPHLRNLHKKTGFDPKSPQTKRGFGFLHDGTFADLRTYFKNFPVFTFNDDTERIDVEAFMMCFGGGPHPATGAQWTMDGTNGQARVDTLVAEADLGVIGLIAKGRDGSGQMRGYAYLGSGLWRPDRAAEPDTDLPTLAATAGPGTELTFTAVLPGEEFRLGVDRDDDGFLDRDERDVSADPDDPLSTPATVVGASVFANAPGPALWMTGQNPTRSLSRMGYSLGRTGPARIEVFDIAGRRVQTLVNNPAAAAGRFESVWDLRDSRGRQVSSGTYFVRLSTPQGTTGKRVVVLR